jgi:hypothetical protein
MGSCQSMPRDHDPSWISLRHTATGHNITRLCPASPNKTRLVEPVQRLVTTPFGATFPSADSNESNHKAGADWQPLGSGPTWVTLLTKSPERTNRFSQGQCTKRCGVGCRNPGRSAYVCCSKSSARQIQISLVLQGCTYGLIVRIPERVRLFVGKIKN